VKNTNIPHVEAPILLRDLDDALKDDRDLTRLYFALIRHHWSFFTIHKPNPLSNDLQARATFGGIYRRASERWDMARRFKHPANNHIETASGPFSWLWCLLFGPIYFAVKGNWRHVFVSLVLTFLTASLSWWIYPFFVYGINAQKYQRDGWIELDAAPKTSRTAFQNGPETPDDAQIDDLIARHKAKLDAERLQKEQPALPARRVAAGFGKRIASPLA
jgi:hypothetical protein